MKSSNIAAAIIGAAAIAAFIAAATTAAPRYDQCHSQSRYLGNNPNDESDSWTHNNHMARCQYGTDADTAARIEHRMARRDDRLDRREQQVAQRRKPSNDFDQRTQARAEAKYQKYGVATWEFCRELDPVRMRQCMSGQISR